MTSHHKTRVILGYKKRKIQVNVFFKTYSSLLQGIVHQTKYLVVMTKDRFYY